MKDMNIDNKFELNINNIELKPWVKSVLTNSYNTTEGNPQFLKLYCDFLNAIDIDDLVSIQPLDARIEKIYNMEMSHSRDNELIKLRVVTNSVESHPYKFVNKLKVHQIDKDCGEFTICSDSMQSLINELYSNVLTYVVNNSTQTSMTYTTVDSLLDHITERTFLIGSSTRRGYGNICYVSKNIMTLIQHKLRNRKYAVDSNECVEGMLSSIIKIRSVNCDMPNVDDKRGCVIVGYRGSSVIDAGISWCPYLMPTADITLTGDKEYDLELMYGLWAASNESGSITSSKDYYHATTVHL